MEDLLMILTTVLTVAGMAGFASEENMDALAGTAAVVAGRVGAGTVVRIADAPAFRGYFVGPARLIANALFYGPAIKFTSNVFR